MTLRHPGIYRLLALSVLLAGSSAVVVASSRNLSLAADSTLWLVGDSTLHPFTSRTTHLQLTAEMDPAQNDIGTILKQHTLKQFDLLVPVKSLESKDTALDKNMYKALKGVECPSIEFHLIRYDVGIATSSTGPTVQASGTLRIACHEQPIVLEGSLTQDQNVLRLQGQYSLLMTDYDVQPPTMMLGAMKVKNPVMIHFDLRLTENPT